MILTTDIRAFIDRPLIARISVIGSDSYPHMVPIWYALEGEDLMFFSSRNARKIAHIRSNSNGAVQIGGEPYGAEGYLLKGDFSLEEDIKHRWLREITFRYEPAALAEKHVAEWGANDYDLIVMRFKPNKVIRI